MVDVQKTPIQYYKQQLQEGKLLPDPGQMQVVEQLQRVYDEISSIKRKRNAWIYRFGIKKTKQVKGLYLWGAVGCGKTHLVDMFYATLPTARKQRCHFHRFMRSVHHELDALKGQRDPLCVVAKKFCAHTWVLCFDEFFVQDVTDAMILAGLLREMFKYGLCLITTSNTAPDDLYKNGVHRERFLPAIALINQHTQVIHLKSDTDYRLRTLEQADIYYTPLDDKAAMGLLRCFSALAVEAPLQGEVIDIDNRLIETVRVSDDVVWFEFDVICGEGRSQRDYLEIARIYHAVVLSNIPVLGGHLDDKVRRFINLIDVFYDHRVKIMLSTAVPIRELYGEGRLRHVFARTQSRLFEMRSHAYLGAEHVA